MVSLARALEKMNNTHGWLADTYSPFSGCHRFEAHQKLGLETIRCRVRKATLATLRMHLN